MCIRDSLTRDLKQKAVKRIVQRPEPFHGPVGQVVPLKRNILSQPGKRVFSEHIAIQLHHRALQHIAHKASLFHEIIVDQGDGAAAPRIGIHQPHFRQLHQRFPDRGA